MLQQAVEALASAEGSAVRAVAIDVDQSTVDFIIDNANGRFGHIADRGRSRLRAWEAKATSRSRLKKFWRKK